MKTQTILRAAAVVLSIATMTVGAGAQSLTALDSRPELVAMTSLRGTDVGEAETSMARGERIAESMAAVKGYEADAEIRGAIEARLAQVAPEAKVLRAVLTADSWSVKMTELGLPKSEYRRGVVIYKLPGEDVVIHQQVVVERPWFALGETDSKLAVRLGTPKAQ